MKKVDLHIKDGKITTDDGKELLLVYVDALGRLQEQLNEANEVIKGYAECYKKYPDGTMFSFEVRKHPAHLYLEKWGVK